MALGVLPETLTVGDKTYDIRTDYRCILQTFEAFNDTELTISDKWEVVIYLLFECFESTQAVEAVARAGFDANEAASQIEWFIQAGNRYTQDDIRQIQLYSWEQDEQIIFSAINSVAHKELRETDYAHWWTFMGYFKEIRESLFNDVVGIRNKLAKGKKLEKYEKDFYRKNRALIDIRKPMSADEQREYDEQKALIEEVIG